MRKLASAVVALLILGCTGCYATVRVPVDGDERHGERREGGHDREHEHEHERGHDHDDRRPDAR